MPVYDYECQKCGEIFEALHGIDEKPPPCPACGAPKPKRLMSAVTIAGAGYDTAAGVEAEIKKRLGQGRSKEALALAEKATKLAGNKKGMGKIKAARDKLRGHLGKD